MSLEDAITEKQRTARGLSKMSKMSAWGHRPGFSRETSHPHRLRGRGRTEGSDTHSFHRRRHAEAKIETDARLWSCPGGVPECDLGPRDDHGKTQTNPGSNDSKSLDRFLDLDRKNDFPNPKVDLYPVIPSSSIQSPSSGDRGKSRLIPAHACALHRRIPQYIGG
jgi:hypothetical protein